MKTTDALRQIMKEQNVGVAKMAGRLNIRQNTMSERLTQQNLSVAKLNEMLRVLDYKVVILPRETTIPKGGIEID